MVGGNTELPGASSLLLRLRETLASCLSSIENGDENESQESVSELVNFLDSVSDAAISEPENEDASENALEVLSETNSFLSSPSLDQSVFDALSFELPKSVSKFAAVSSECSEIARGVIDRFIETCSPRDMLSILCEALDSVYKTTESSACVSPLLCGLSKVICSIQRRHFEQVKVTVPVVLEVLEAILSESSHYGYGEPEKLFDAAIGIADSIHSVSVKLEGVASEKLRAILGLYILQMETLVSVGTKYKISSRLSVVAKLESYLPHCDLSYLGLITGSDVDKITSLVVGEDEDDHMSCFSHVSLGAALSVIWGQISDNISQSAKEDLNAVKGELQTYQTKRWEALGMLKHVFASVDLPWELKKHSLEFLISIANGNNSTQSDCEDSDYSHYATSLYSSLQALIMVLVHAPEPVIRRHAFEAIKRVLADLPSSLIFDILTALITNTDSSSMIAILLDFVRNHMLNSDRPSTWMNEGQIDKNKPCKASLYWNPCVLELVKLVLKPPQGGPPVLPDSSDAVLSALNLYRVILLKESAGKTNYTGVLSKDKLETAYNEWLLPLRTLVTGIITENKDDDDQLAIDTVCALNPVEAVVYRCIELVEEKLKQSTD